MKATIRASNNGPYILTGPVTVEDQKGNIYQLGGKSVKLCRCGDSANMPFCDDHHLTNGFISVVQAGVRPSSDYAFIASLGPSEIEDLGRD